MRTTNKGERHALARIKPGNGSDVASHSAVVPTTGSGSCARWWDLGAQKWLWMPLALPSMSGRCARLRRKREWNAIKMMNSEEAN